MSVFSLPHRSVEADRTMAGTPVNARSRRCCPRWWRLGAGVPVALLVMVLAAGCDHSPPPTQASKPVQVVVTEPITYEVTDYQDFTGRLDALKTVEVRSRVAGYVTDAPFKEGD